MKPRSIKTTQKDVTQKDVTQKYATNKKEKKMSNKLVGAFLFVVCAGVFGTPAFYAGQYYGSYKTFDVLKNDALKVEAGQYNTKTGEFEFISKDTRCTAASLPERAVAPIPMPRGR